MVSRRLPIAAARVLFLRSYGICGNLRGTEVGFLRVLLLPLLILIPVNAPYSLITLYPRHTVSILTALLSNRHITTSVYQVESDPWLQTVSACCTEELRKAQFTCYTFNTALYNTVLHTPIGYVRAVTCFTGVILQFHDRLSQCRPLHTAVVGD
jgi:hypothetical protein